MKLRDTKTLSLMLMGLLLTVGFTGFSYASASGLAIDGQSGCANGNSNTCSAALTTYGAADVIIVVEGTQSGHVATAPSDTDSLVWVSRSDISTSGNLDQHVYYAITLAPLTGDIIKCNFNNNARSSCLFFGISGAFISQPFDTHVGVPCTSSGTSVSPSCPISTSNSPEMILGLTTTGCDVPVTSGSGFALIVRNDVCGPSMGAEYQVVSSDQSGLNVGFSISPSQSWVISSDAIVAASATATNVAQVTGPVVMMEENLLTQTGGWYYGETSGAWINTGAVTVSYNFTVDVSGGGVATDQPNLGSSLAATLKPGVPTTVINYISTKLYPYSGSITVVLTIRTCSIVVAASYLPCGPGVVISTQTWVLPEGYLPPCPDGGESC